MAPSCKFESLVWEHFNFLVSILLLFYVWRWKDIQIYMFWMWNTISIQTEIQIIENWHQKLKPNRTEKYLNLGSPIGWLFVYWLVDWFRWSVGELIVVLSY